MNAELLAGRSLETVYRVSGKTDIYEFLLSACRAAGARVIYASAPSRAPVYLGLQLDSDERMGVLVYPFRMKRKTTNGRPGDEVRGQLRYGAESSWAQEHPLARDVAGVDVTLVLGVDLEEEIFVGLDASLWDPLPMGISFYAKAAEIKTAKVDGWHVWEKSNTAGNKRRQPRSPDQLETVIAFSPHRILDYVRLERRATLLGLDSPLRFSLGKAMKSSDVQQSAPASHVLERQFALSSEQILDIIGGRSRLTVAVRGGVAEQHLQAHLEANPSIANVRRLDEDGKHDFDVELRDGRTYRVECKNVSPKRSKDGLIKVEVQKTRSSKGDPASRYYAADAFDVVAACTFSATGRWEFVFNLTSNLLTHKDFPDRLAAIQQIGSNWQPRIESLPAALR